MIVKLIHMSVIGKLPMSAIVSKMSTREAQPTEHL
jgi:hypothetical protein